MVVEESRHQLTVAASSIGTPLYMPPEQRHDPSSVDERADVYSSGVLLYELLTGRRARQTR